MTVNPVASVGVRLVTMLLRRRHRSWLRCLRAEFFLESDPGALKKCRNVSSLPAVVLGHWRGRIHVVKGGLSLPNREKRNESIGKGPVDLPEAKAHLSACYCEMTVALISDVGRWMDVRWL